MTATTLSPREMKRRRKQGADYVPPSPYTVKAALTHGDVFTKLSAVVFGLGNIVRKQYVKGIAMLALEVAFFVFMATNGVGYLSKLPSLGEKKGGKKLVDGFWQYVEPDRSVVILLYGVASLVICVAFVGLWVMSVRSAYKSQVLLEENGKAPSFMDDVRELLDAKAHVLLMFLPTLGIAVFTVLPLIFMISMAFTSYDHKHLVLFHWVGFENFAKVFSNSGGTVNAALFGRVLVWTLVWAFFATFLNFFFGMFVAMIINRKTTHFKGFWRACFSMSIAVPQFVSLLVMHTMLQPQGAVNRMLQTWGWIDGPLPFFTNATWARVTVIIINLWVGIPYTIMQITGILQNIPADQYEAAKIDGANWWQIFTKITLPLSKPMIVYTALTQFAWPWSDCLLPKLLLKNRDQWTVAVGLFSMPETHFSRFAAGIVAMSMNSCAYVAEIIRSGIQAVDYGQTEAARSLGFRQSQTMTMVVLPQAVKNILPALGNEFVTVIKESSIVSVIGIADLMFRSKDVIAVTYISLETLAIAAILYFIMTFISGRFVSLMERKMSNGTK